MANQSNLVTVFRSADETAEDDARAIAELLSAQDLQVTLDDSTAPGVPAGAWVVRVPAEEAERAEQVMAEAEEPPLDESHRMDTETVFSGEEVEMEAVKGVLENAGIATVVMGTTTLPMLGFQVQVARDRAEEARSLIAEALAHPLAAEEAAG